MSKPKILVTGATGNTGLPVVRQLLARGLSVRAMVQALDCRSAALEKLGVELTPFYPGYPFDRWDRKLRLPQPSSPSLSIDDETWRHDHYEMMNRRAQTRPSLVLASEARS